MPIGVTMIKSASSYYSPTITRRGCIGIFTVDVMINEGAATLDIDIEHKNNDDTSWATSGTTFVQWTGTTGYKTAEVSGLKEMIRFKYDVGGDAGDFVHVLVHQPIWRDS